MEPVAATSGWALPAIVGIVGAGTMGAGIGQVALEAGCEVVFYDVDEAALDVARERILENGLATVTGIDEAMRDGGFPMGPFELMDLTGIDVTFAAATGIWEGLGRPDRLRPSPIQEAMVEAGDLGRKTGRGFYEYGDGQRLGEAEQPADTPSEDHLSPERIRGLILDAIATEARFAVDEGVATPDVIDLALRLGAGHPHGPFESRRPPS